MKSLQLTMVILGLILLAVLAIWNIALHKNNKELENEITLHHKVMEFQSKSIEDIFLINYELSKKLSECKTDDGVLTISPSAGVEPDDMDEDWIFVPCGTPDKKWNGLEPLGTDYTPNKKF